MHIIMKNGIILPQMKINLLYYSSEVQKEDVVRGIFYYPKYGDFGIISDIL